MKAIDAQVNRFRNLVIEGKCIDLVPYEPRYAKPVVRLRNLPSVRYFLNQDHESTPASQHAWYSEYLDRHDDIFWVIKAKDGRFLGCNRLYDITPTALEKGSLIVAPEVAQTLPAALEADLLGLRCAFAGLGVETVITKTRHDNVKMQSINTRLGFQAVGMENVRGIPYSVSSLSKSAFGPEKFEIIINHWSKRHERPRS